MARDETIKLSLIDGVTKSLTAIQKGVGGVGAELAKLNQVAELAGKGFAALGNIAGGIGDAVSGVADLETALARVVDITQATTEEQVALQQAVRDAATEVGVTADQAAGALVLMAEDGFSASEAVASLNTVLSYAKANAQDAATATQALGGVLDTFGEKPAIIAQLADQLTAASRAAGVGTSVLQSGLAAIGVQAEQAGLGVSEATAALAALASRGIEGTQAAKQLGTVLTELNNPASKAGKALDDAGLAGKSFADIVDALSKDTAKAAPILEALGNRPRAALKVLLAEGGGALREFGAIVDGAAGASERAAATIDETFNGAVARLQAAVGNLRNEFLSPILQPLADDAAKVAEQINSLADSPQFARVREQFAAMATGAIQSVGNLIENADLEQWAGDIAAFAEDAKTAFEALVVVVQATADTIRAIGSAVEYVREVTATVDAAFAEATGATNRLNVAAREAGKSIDGLGVGLDKNKKRTRELSTEVDGAAGSAQVFATAVDDAGTSAADAAESMAPMPRAAHLIEVSLGSAAAAADMSALSLNALQKRLQAVREELSAAAPGSPQFVKLAQDAAALEAQIAKTKQQIDEASGANEKLADSSDRASASLRNQAAAARDAGDSSRDAADSVSQATDEFGNIGNQSSSAAVSMGTLTEEFVRNALAVAGNAKSVRDYLRTINDFFAQGQDEENQLRAMIEIRERQNATLTEEERIRKRIQDQYGTSSTLVEVLVQQELKLAEARKKANQEAERGIEIEQRRAGLAGGIGTGANGAQPAAPATSAGRGTVAGAGSRDAAPAIVVNVSGAPTDAAGWRDIVSRFIAPELERINRLNR